MVGMGLLMMLVAWTGSYFAWRKNSMPKPVLIVVTGMMFSGWVATLAGWYVTEIGRQPYLVSGILTTADAVTSLPSKYVGISLAMYLSVYVVLLIAYIYTLLRMARKAVAVPEYENADVPHVNAPPEQEILGGNA